MPNNNGTEVYESFKIVKTGGHGRMTKQQAKALKDKWNAKIYRASDSDNGDNEAQSVTPP
jgi:hypothetical protein